VRFTHPIVEEDDFDPLTLSFIESLEEIKQEIETIKDSNGVLFTALQNMLNELMMKNAEAMVSANNQFMHLIMRKLDELEERITSDEPAFTNVLYSDPELFNEISARGEAQVAAQEIFEAEESTEQEEQIPSEVVEGYNQWQAKEIKWSDFVKISGGIKKAGEFKKLLSSSS
jgi:hypothetical protein